MPQAIRLIAAAAALTLGACTVNTSPPVVAAPSPVVVQQPATVAPQGSTVFVQPAPATPPVVVQQPSY